MRNWVAALFNIDKSGFIHYNKCRSLIVRNADVAELADALDLGSSAARRMGSTPFIRTK